MPLAAMFAVFSMLGLLIAILDLAAKHNSPAPSMYRSEVGSVGIAVFLVCGLLAIATFFSVS